MKKLLIAIISLALTALPLSAADNAVTVTIGSGPTLRSIDVGAGVQAMGQTLVNTSGTSIIGGGTTMPISGSITTVTSITNAVTVAQPTAANLNATVVQGTAANLNATIVGTGTFAVQAAQSGTWNITNISGTVTLPTGASTAAKQPAFGTAGTASADIITVQGITSMTPLLVTLSGTNNINTVSTVTAVTAITNALPAGSNVIGHIIADTGSTTAVTQATSSNLKAQVDPLTIATWGLSVGTTPATAPTNNLIVGGIYNSSSPSPTTGQTLPIQLDSSGNLKVNIVAGAGGGASLTDGGTFTEGVTSFTPVGGEYVSGGGANCTSNKGCTAQMTIDRMVYTNIGKVGGAATGTAGSAGTGVLTVQGIASMTPVLTNPGTAASWALDATGAAVPANALYVGINSGGNLTGWTGAVTNTGTFGVQATLQASPTISIGKVNPDTIANWGLMAGTVPVAAPVNTMLVGAIYNSSPPAPTTGQTLPFQLDSSGNLNVNIKAGAGSGGTAIADKAAWTVSSTTFTLTGGEFTTGGATACTTGQACTLGMTADRAAFVNIADIAGAATLTGNGVTGTGSQRVTIASDNTAFSVNAVESGTWNITNISGTITLPTLASTSTKQSDGSQKTQIVDGSGNVIASTSNNLNVQCANCSGSGASAADAATFTAGSSTFAPAGGEFTSGGATACVTGHQCFVGITAARAFLMDVSSIAGTTTLTGNGVTGAGSQRVTIASDNTAFAVNATLSAETTKVIGTVNQGTSPWVISGSLTANQSVNVAQINGVTPLMGNGVTGTGSQRVTIASDNTAFAVNATLQASSATAIGTVNPTTIGNWGLQVSTQNSAAPTNGQLQLCQFTTSPTTITTTNVSPIQCDNANNQLVKINVALPTGSNVIGHVIADTGSTTAVTQATASNLNATVVGTGTFVVQATLAAETTKVIGTVNQGTSPWVNNTSQINGVTPLMGNGITGTGSQRVTIASDNTAFAVNATLQTGANVIGALTANQSVNVAQINGVTPLMGNGVTGTGSQRVTIASDNTAFSVNATLQATATTAIGKVDPNTIGTWGLAASTQNVATPTNGMLVQGEFNTTPTTITTGNSSPLQLDSAGNLLVNIKAGAGSGGTAIADKAAWTVSSTTFTLSGGEFTTGGATACTTGQACTVGMTATRGFFTDLSTVNAVTVLTGTGAVGTGAQRIAVGTDTATIAGSAPGTAGSASANVVTVQGIASMTKLLVTPDANSAVNLAQVGGGTVALGSTTASASIPVVIASNQTAADPCMFQAKTNVTISTASGTINLVTGVSAKKIYVCSLVLVTTTAVSVSLAEGSATLCATSSQAGVMGVATNGTAANGIPLSANGGITLGNGGGTVASTATAANYLCLFQSGTAQIAGNLTYVQQ